MIDIEIRDKIISYLYDLIFYKKTSHPINLGEIEQIQNIIDRFHMEEKPAADSVIERLLQRKKEYEEKILKEHGKAMREIGPDVDKLVKYMNKNVDPAIQVERFFIDMQLKSLGYNYEM